MMRFLLPAALAVALLTGFVPTEIGATWSAHAPVLALLVVIIFLLWRQQSRRDFYVVQHLGYDSVFEEHPGPRVTAKRGPLIGGFSESFSDFGAAKAYFDLLEQPSSRPAEEVHHIYVVRGRKPSSMFTLTPHPKAFTDKPLGLLIQSTPYSDISARRREACENHRVGIENERDVAELRRQLETREETRRRIEVAEMDLPRPLWTSLI